MSRMKGRSVVVALISLILLSIILRYPLVSHERFQTDSYFIHILADSIVKEDYAVWTVDPLSYVGYYPLSYPSGMPFLISEVSIMTGTSIEVSILLSCLVLGVLFCVIAFCLARAYLRNNVAILLAVLFTVLAPRLVDTTYWNGSARGLAVALIILVIVLASQYESKRRIIFPILSVPVVFIVLTVHHMILLLIFFALAYLIAVVGTRFLRLLSTTRHRRTYIAASAIIGLVSLVAVLSQLHILGRLVIVSYGVDGVIDSSFGVLAIVANMGISYTHQIGLIFPIAVIGYFWYLWKETARLRIHYPFAVLVAFTPLMGYGLYVSMLLVPFVAILFAFLIAEMWRKQLSQGSIKVIRAFVALLVVLSLTSVVLSVDRWNASRYDTGDEVEVSNQVYADAIYMYSNYGGEHAIFNQPVLGVEFQALGGVYSTSASGVESMISGDVTPEMLQGNVTRSWAPFPLSVYLLYSYEYDYVARGYSAGLMIHGISFVQNLPALYYQTSYWQYCVSHSRFLVIIDNSWPQNYITHYEVYDSEFLTEVRDSTSSLEDDSLCFVSYHLYQSEGITQYAAAFDI